MNIREIEKLLGQVDSVISSKIVVDNQDNIEEIHILSTKERSPKQLSRDIQSVLISRFGIDIDHKKISIAQIDEKSLEDKDFRLKLKSIEFTTFGIKANVKVTLGRNGKSFEGSTTGPNTTYNFNKLLSLATLRAVEKFLDIEDNFILDDIKIIELAGREVVVTSITFVTEYGEQMFTGSAFINKDKKEAVVKATLDAINRKIILCYNES
jgi:hypothetical protein